MEIKEYGTIFSLEQEHWWYKGMREISFSLLKKKTIGKNLRILDTGCGTGFNILELKKYGKVYGIDFSREALRFCKIRNLRNIHLGTIENLKFKNNYFDIITSFDVIYHLGVKNDLKALKEFHRVLKKGGYLVLRVPAFNFLYSGHDKVVHTKRRYTKKELSGKMESAGFKIERMSYLNFFLSPFVLIARLLNRDKEQLEITKTNPHLNKILFLVLALESKLLNFIDFPFGVSIIALARKK